MSEISLNVDNKPQMFEDLQMLIGVFKITLADIFDIRYSGLR